MAQNHSIDRNLRVVVEIHCRPQKRSAIHCRLNTSNQSAPLRRIESGHAVGVGILSVALVPMDVVGCGRDVSDFDVV